MKEDPDPTERLFSYIALLEETNHQLMVALKKCHTLLSEFTPQVPNPESWKAMLKDLHGVIEAARKSVGRGRCIDQHGRQSTNN